MVQLNLTKLKLLSLVQSFDLLLMLFSNSLYVFSMSLLSIKNVLLKLNVLFLKLLIHLLSLLIVVSKGLNISLELQHPLHELVGLLVSLRLHLKKLILV